MSEPKLNWIESRAGGHLAHAGHLTLRAEDGGWWSVDTHGVTLVRGHETTGTIESAWLAAEEQAQKIAAAMLTPFATDEHNDEVIGDANDHESWMDVDEYAGTDPGEAHGLALALLAAAERHRP